MVVIKHIKKKIYPSKYNIIYLRREVNGNFR